jgi:hypothetical protein
MNPDVPANQMRFNWRTWTFEINPGWLAGADTTVNRFNGMVELLYHEARHAYQAFQVARWRAMKVNQRVALTEPHGFDVDATIQARAAETPMVPGDPLEADAAAWHESMWGGRADERATTLRDWNALGVELERQRTRVEALPETAPDSTRARENHQLQSLMESYDSATKEYMALPEEVDAYKAGWARGAWARWGLAERYRARVEAAETQVSSTKVRVATTARELNFTRAHDLTTESMAEAQEHYNQALAEAEEAEQSLRAARASR